MLTAAILVHRAVNVLFIFALSLSHQLKYEIHWIFTQYFL